MNIFRPWQLLLVTLAGRSTGASMLSIAKTPSGFRDMEATAALADVSPPFGQNYSALSYPPMEVRSRVVAKAGETLFVSGDRGDNWEEVDFGGGPDDNLMAIYFAKRW